MTVSLMEIGIQSLTDFFAGRPACDFLLAGGLVCGQETCVLASRARATKSPYPCPGCWGRGVIGAGGN